MNKFLAVLLAFLFLGCSGESNPVGTSKLSYLKKIRDGVVFSEGFENDNFIAAEGWTTVQGTPGNSLTQAKVGIKSWDNQANGGLPVAKKIITDTNVDANWFFVVWFYDTGNTTSPGPYCKIKLANGNYISVGVRNSVSTTCYSYADSGASVDEPITAIASAVRSVGWHSFALILNTNTTLLLVDTSITYLNLFHSLVSEIYLCSGKVGGLGPSFGYFDSLGYFRNTGFGFYFNRTNVSLALWNSSNANITYSNNPSSPCYLYAQIYSTLYPISVYFQMDQYIPESLLYRSPLMSINPGDIYQYVSVDFGRKLTTYKPTETGLINSHQSTSGVTETIFNVYKNKYIFGVNDLQGLPMKSQLNNWYENAEQGYPFSIMVDSGHNGFGVMDSNALIGSSTVGIMPNLATNPTDSFEAGREYLLFNSANTRRQKLTLLTKNNTTLTFSSIISEPFLALDYVCETTLHPFLEVGTNPDGFQMTNERYIRFNWNQSCQDLNEA
jgi:hypothetical protein